LTIFGIFERMKWIIFLGLIGYYLYKAYLDAAKKQAQEGNLPEKSGRNNSPSPKKQKSFEDILKDLEDALEGKTTPPQPQTTAKQEFKPYAQQQKRTIYESKRDEDSIENETMYMESVEDGTIDKYSNLGNYKSDVSSIESMETRIEAVDVEGFEKQQPKPPKFMMLNKKKMNAKDLFTAQIILEKKF
jgi:hypothetical protein